MKLSKGFTLIELIVVMAVFLFIIGAAIGIFISIIQNQKKVLAQQQVLNQISYVEEYMSKALRMAAVDSSGSCLPLGSNSEQYIYLLTHYNSGLAQGIKFINQNSSICQEFFLGNCDAVNPSASVLCEIKGVGSPVAITSSDLEIKSIRFAIDGDTTNCNGVSPCGASNIDSAQPRVTALLNVAIPGDSNDRIIQTTVSQRNLNVK